MLGNQKSNYRKESEHNSINQRRVRAAGKHEMEETYSDDKWLVE